MNENFEKPWDTFRGAVAFVKRSGTKHIFTSLSNFSKSFSAEWIVGIDHRGTSSEGLNDLMVGVRPNGRVVVFHNAIASTFHPKVYLFKDDKEADVLIGSGNMTEGGLFTNYEAAVRVKLQHTNEEDARFLATLEAVLDNWIDPSNGTAKVLDESLLAKLVANGYVPIEALITKESVDGSTAPSTNPDEKKEVEKLFSSYGITPAPKATAGAATSGKSQTGVASKSGHSGPSAATAAPVAMPFKGFVMTLQKTDVGVGQTSSGASRRSPEIFIPLSARNADPEFWGWPTTFTEDETKPGKFDRTGVRFRLGADIFQVNMMTWPDKHDFRLRSEALRSAGNIGDILRLEMAPENSAYEYFAVVIPQGATEFGIYKALCTNAVRNSKKMFGYY
ncbi:MAG: phospholipase D family protein [Pseudomonadota bacterium]